LLSQKYPADQQTGRGLETILVLTGVTRREDVPRFPYRPTQIVESVADIAV
jgi:NagD protein